MPFQPKAIPVSLHAAPLPPAVVVSPAANAAVTSVATTPPTPSKKHDAAFFDEQEERLKALKRLRDKDLISEPEFQQKRKEILQAM